MSCCFSGPHRYEQYTPEQGPSERCFDDLLITFGFSVVSLKQCCDVESHLCDGAERGIHHRPHCKVTLSRNAVEIRTVIRIQEQNYTTSQNQNSFISPTAGTFTVLQLKWHSRYTRQAIIQKEKHT